MCCIAHAQKVIIELSVVDTRVAASLWRVISAKMFYCYSVFTQIFSRRNKKDTITIKHFGTNHPP